MKLVCSLQNRAGNKLEMIAMNCINIWPKLILISPWVLKKQTKVQLLICSNLYDDATDFEVSEFTKNKMKYKKNKYLEKETLFFLQIKKVIDYTLGAL